MVYSKIHFSVILRIGLIALTCFVLAFEYFLINDLIINLNLIFLLIVQSWLLINKINETNKDLHQFFKSIKYNEGSLELTKQSSKNKYSGFYIQLNEINDYIQNMKIENERQNQFFKTITEHANVGLIVFNDKGNVSIINDTAKHLLNLSGLTNIRSLSNIEPDFPEIISNLKPGEHKLLKLKISKINAEKLIIVTLKSTRIKIGNEITRIVSIQNIKNELEENEIESWQKLIRVLTHEMMNSIGPISSSIETMKEILANDENNDYNEIIPEIIEGLDIIKERSDGLYQFIEKYKTLTSVPKPCFVKFKVQELFTNVIYLLEKDFLLKRITVNYEVVPSDLELYADKKLISQVIINLLINAMQALENTSEPKIQLKAYINDEAVSICISDNGKGIQKEIADKIFIPFFTTKEKGSGIGLSLSKQIMKLHGGTIFVESNPNVETVFTLKF